MIDLQSLKANLKTGVILSPLSDLFSRSKQVASNLEALDGLRGLAALMVVIEHSKIDGFQGIGRVGVFLFFVLSSFLLTRQFIIQPSRLIDRSQLSKYFIRRILRIVPLYYTYILILTFFRRYDISFTVEHMLFYRGDGIFWAIPQEVLFYFFIPLIYLTFHLFFSGRKLVFATVLFFLSLLLVPLLDQDVITMRSFLNGAVENRRFFITTFMFGSVAAFIFESSIFRRIVNNDANRVWQNFFSSIGVAIFVFYVAVIPSFTSTINSFIESNSMAGLLLNSGQNSFAVENWVLTSLVCTITLFSVLLNKEFIISKVFSSLILRVYGVISFSLYLSHQYVLAYVYNVLNVDFGWLLLLVTLAIATPVSFFTYSTIERTFILRK